MRLSEITKVVQNVPKSPPPVPKLSPRPQSPAPTKPAVAAPISTHAASELKRSKRRQKRLSEGAAVLGLSALATRAPQAARYLGSKVPRAAGSRPLNALARLEPKATKVSEAIVPTSLGVGALGSLNFASQQGKEAKTLPVKTPKVASLDGVEKNVPRFLRSRPRPTATTRIAQKYSAVPFGHPRQFARRDFPWVPAEDLSEV